MLDSIEKSKNVPLHKFLNALGIQEVGIKTAVAVEAKWKDWLKIANGIFIFTLVSIPLVVGAIDTVSITGVTVMVGCNILISLFLFLVLISTILVRIIGRKNKKEEFEESNETNESEEN